MYPKIISACFFNAFYQVKGCLRLDEGRHVLDAEGVDSHILQSAGLVNKKLCSVNRAYRVADRTLSVFACLFDCTNGALYISQVIECVENTEDVHTVFCRLVAESLYHLILVVAIPKKILAAQQHLQRSFWHELFEGAQPFPRVLIQKADA